MNALEAVVSAVLGWRDLLQYRDGWRSRFDLSRDGFVGAVALFVLAVILNVALQMIRAGQASALQVAVNLAYNLLPLAGLALAILASVVFLRRRGDLYALLVPATYALGLALIVGLPLSLLPLPLGILMLIGLGYLLYRLGREVCRFTVGMGLAFVATCLVALVALPVTLYMLLAAIPGLN